MWKLWLHSLKVAQLLRSAACLHTNQSLSYLNHLVLSKYEAPGVMPSKQQWSVRSTVDMGIQCNTLKLTILRINDLKFHTALVPTKEVWRNILCGFDHSLTSEYHVRDDNIFTYAGQNIWTFKQIFILRSVCHSCQKVRSTAHKLKITTIFEQHLTNTSGQKQKIKSGQNCFTTHPENPRSACIVKHHSVWNVQCSNTLLHSTSEQQSSNDTIIHYAICYVPCLCQHETSLALGARK